MNEIINKISSYNIFNYLYPGAIYMVAAKELQIFVLPSNDLITKLLVFYFSGMCISRFGSLVLEPFLKSLKFVNYAPYGSYLDACKIDDKIDLMIEVNNTYRTVSAAFLLLAVSWLLNDAANFLDISLEIRHAILICAIALLFLVSFRKQTDFVRKRVEHRTKAN